MRATRPIRVLQSGLLLAVASAVALLLGEFLVRRLVPQPKPLTIALRGLHAPDAELGYTMVPGFSRLIHTYSFTCDVRTNSLGLRDQEIGPHRSGCLRLMGIGDSFVLGIHAGPPDSCFVERLGHDLDAELRAHPVTTPDGRTWSGAEAINAGVDGYGTSQEVGLLERLGPQLQPDAVLLAFYLGNDFTDNSGRTRMTVVDGYQMLEASEAGYRNHFRPLQRRVRLWLHAHSDLYAFLKERLVNPVRELASPGPEGAPGGGAPGSKSFDYYIYDAGFAACLRAAPSPELASSLEATRSALLELRHWCDAHQVQALVVALPAEQQVSPEARHRWIQRFGLDAADLDFTLPNQRLAALAAEAGLPYFDLTPGFAARIARGADLHLHGDNHWNTAGHALAARLLAEPVLEDLVLAPPPLIGAR
jgi:hypothetical protein